MKFSLSTLTAILILVSFISCNQQADQRHSADTHQENEVNFQPVMEHSGTVVEVTAMHSQDENLHQFDLSDNEIPSGWTTFRFHNASPYDHFMILFKVPDVAVQGAEEAGMPLLDYWYNAVTKPFQHEFNPYAAGDIDYETFVNNLVQGISENGAWFFDPGPVPTGGPGFTAAGFTSETSVNLEQGYYIVECYVKDSNEVFHSYIGMLDLLTVTDQITSTPEPENEVMVTISSQNGIVQNGNLTQGTQTIQIYYEDQMAYEHLLGHNVQLVKLSENDNDDLLNDLALWMDWTRPGGLAARAPEGAEFIGGSMEMVEGGVAYLHVNLEPGEYAWIAEVPNPAGKNMLKTFTIPAD